MAVGLVEAEQGEQFFLAPGVVTPTTPQKILAVGYSHFIELVPLQPQIDPKRKAIKKIQKRQ
jgi:hypothetical protein